MEENQALVNPAIRPIFFFLGWLSFVLGFVGAFLPVLPTTPFLILAAFFFSKSSSKVHTWLLGLPTFGPMIEDWENNRVIRPRAKALAISVLTLVMGTSILFAGLNSNLQLMLGGIWLLVGLFLLTRKSRP